MTPSQSASSEPDIPQEPVAGRTGQVGLRLDFSR